MALEIVCQTAPFLAIGTGVRFMELVTLLLRREKVSWMRVARRWRGC